MLEVVNALIEVNKKRYEREKLNQKIQQLHKQEIYLNGQISIVEKQLEADNIQVDLIENATISSIVDKMVNSSEEEQNKYSNQLKYIKLKDEYLKVYDEIEKLKEEIISQYSNIDNEYQSLMSIIETYILDQGGPKANKVKEILSNRDKFQVEVKELSETINVGNKLLKELNFARERLERLRKWVIKEENDNLLSSFQEHEYLDEAQDRLYKIQWLLRQYHNELKNVGSDFTDEFDISKFLMIVDYWIDDLFLDNSLGSTLEDLIDSIKKLITNIIQIDEKIRRELEESKLKVLAMNKEYEKTISDIDM